MKIVHKVIYTCEEATRYVVQKNEVKLSLMQRFRLWMHMQLCEACRRFQIQNDWIDQQLANLLPNEHDHLNAKKKAEMDNTLKEAIKNKPNL